MQKNLTVEAKPKYILSGRSGFGILWTLEAVLMRLNMMCGNPAQRGKPSEKVFSNFVIHDYSFECLVLKMVQVSSAPASSEEPQAHQNSILDEMEDERAFTNVLPDATILLWSKLLERRGYQITDGEVILSPSKADAPPPNAKKSDSPIRPNMSRLHSSGSVISSLRRVAPVVQANPGTSKHLPFRRSSSATSTVAGAVARSSEVAAVRPLLEKEPAITEIVREAEASSSRSAPAPSTTGSMIFAGMVFRALGEAKCQNVRRAIDELGGRMSADEDEDVDFVIVRLVR
jgi:DNA replication regulator DPB11